MPATSDALLPAASPRPCHLGAGGADVLAGAGAALGFVGTAGAQGAGGAPGAKGDAQCATGVDTGTAAPSAQALASTGPALQPTIRPTTGPTTDSAAADITQLLHRASAGDAAATDQVVAQLYHELRRIASSRLRQCGDLTLDATALVHESYLRLQRSAGLDFPDRKHFLGYAARVMRSIVIDQVRARQAERHGGELQQVTFNTGIAELPAQRDDEVLRVHEALDELAALDPRLAQVVEMRYFAGMTEPEIAQALGLTERTVQRDWRKARLFLAMAMQ